ncbi:MAG: hypothetical protein FD124_1165 [Alphaproteobacteria bacterium]|nr:MAG: hypothetical protein FD160_1837 [Caulobacteraceae bacterium]TPW07413.1 MAG: hypothetical protein FD124_1165 [Alphaproteobacteria bacterium]
MKEGDLVPLKRVLDEIGVSRVTLWRALNSGIEEFPKPTIIRRRVYWAPEELKSIEAAFDAYRGRCAFDAKRMRDRLRKERRHETLVDLMQGKRRSKRRPAARKASDDMQKDFFEP